ncbi:MAG: hypothetical protein WA459_00285 [Stellaceae bacterium]
MAQDRSSVIAGGTVTYDWQCANSHAQSGDLAWIMRYGAGVAPKGIVARGVVTSKPFPDHHPTLPQRMTPHVKIKLTEIRQDVVPLSALEQAYPSQTWNPRLSGILIKLEAVRCLEHLW